MVNEEKSALSGLRVIEVGTYIFGPAAATVMSDFGAEVIKVEAPGIGDPYRYLHTIPPMPPSEQEYCWLLDGRNKRSIVVDLKHRDGQEVVFKLLMDADVFLTNFHPSVLSDLQLTCEKVRAANPRIVYAHATGYGEHGPEVEKPGYDMTAWWARSGMMDLVRSGDIDPALSVAGMGDHPSSMALFGAIMLALFHRERTGEGSKVSTSLMANGAWANSCLIQAALCGAEPYVRRSRAGAFNALVNHYTSRDGKRFILCGIRGDKDWEALCNAIGSDGLTHDARFALESERKENMAELNALLDEAFVTRDMGEWNDLFEEHGLTYGPVCEYAELGNDDQMAANGVFVEMDHPRYGTLRTVNSPISMEQSEKVTPRPAPELGQHTVEILEDAGYSRSEIRQLCEDGAVGTGPL